MSVYGRYGLIVEKELMQRLNIKEGTFQLFMFITKNSRENIIKSINTKLEDAFEGVDVIIDGVHYRTMYQLETSHFNVTVADIVFNRSFDNRINSVLSSIQEFFKYGRQNLVRDDQYTYTVNEAILRYQIPEYQLQEMVEHTGLSYRELIYIYMYHRNSIDTYYTLKVQKAAVQTLEPIKVESKEEINSNNIAKSTYSDKDVVKVLENQPVKPVKQQTTSSLKVTESRTQPRPQNQHPRETVSSNTTAMINYEGNNYNSVEHLCSSLSLDYTLFQLDTRKFGLSMKQAIDKQYKGKGTRTSNNAMYINGLAYNSQREVCNVFGLEEKEVATFKSKMLCDSYSAVIHFITKKYGEGYFV